MISARRAVLGSGFFPKRRITVNGAGMMWCNPTLSSPLGPRVCCRLHDIFLHFITRPIYGGTIHRHPPSLVRPDKGVFSLIPNRIKIKSAIRPKLKSMVRLQPVLSKPNWQSRRPHNPYSICCRCYSRRFCLFCPSTHHTSHLVT